MADPVLPNTVGPVSLWFDITQKRPCNSDFLTRRITSGRTGSSTGSGLRRKVKARKASSSKTGNLASELLDMLLSTSNDEFEESESEQDSSDEAWK